MLNLIVICLETTGLYISVSARKQEVFAYYTQLANMVTLVSSVLVTLFGFTALTMLLRYLWCRWAGAFGN